MSGLIGRRNGATGALAVAASLAILAVWAAPSDAIFAGKPGRIAYSAELPGEDQTSPNPPPNGTIDRGFDIFTVNPDGSDTRRVTQNGTEPDDEVSPSSGPDGTLLAFSTRFPFRPNEFGPYPVRPESQLEVIAPDGGGRRVVLSSFDGPSSPLFSPDGERLFYFWSDVDFLQSGIRSVRLDGSDLRLEDRNLFDSYGPHVSTDGRRKVFSGQGDIFISRIDGSQAVNLTNTPGVFEFDPAFAPDMSAVVFVRSVGSNPPFPGVVTVLDLETGAQNAISPPQNVATAPEWGAIPVNCGGRRATIVGTEGKDRLIGTKAADVIAGLGGRDKIKGKGAKDRLCGNGGPDRLVGGKKSDRCFGGSGSDRAKGCEREKSA